MDTLDALKTLIADEFNIPKDSILNNASIHRDLNFDSVDTVTLISSIEYQFSVKFDQEHIQSINTLSELDQYLIHLLEEKSRSQ